jgi:hypothetical protein
MHLRPLMRKNYIINDAPSYPLKINAKRFALYIESTNDKSQNGKICTVLSTNDKKKLYLKELLGQKRLNLHESILG